MTNESTPASQPSQLHRFNELGRCIDCDTHETYNGARLTCPNAPRPQSSPARSDMLGAERVKPWRDRLPHPFGDCTASEIYEAQEAEIADWRATQGTPTDMAEREDTGLRANEAARLRRVVNLLGIGSQVPEDDATLRSCLFSVLGTIARKIEAGRTPSSETIATWRERIHAAGMHGYKADTFMEAEIADLRAALPRRAAPAPLNDGDGLIYEHIAKCADPHGHAAAVAESMAALDNAIIASSPRSWRQHAGLPESFRLTGGATQVERGMKACIAELEMVLGAMRRKALQYKREADALHGQLSAIKAKEEATPSAIPDFEGIRFRFFKDLTFADRKRVLQALLGWDDKTMAQVRTHSDELRCLKRALKK